MSTMEMDHVFTAALREVLVATVRNTPRARRRWRWRAGTGVFLGLTVAAGGAALASGVFSLPGAPVNSPIGNVVTASRTGTATIYLGTRPATATDVSLTLTCLTADTFDFPDGSSMSCNAADIGRPEIFRQSIGVMPLNAGVDTVTIKTSSNASWTLQAMYVNQVTTPWGVNTSGETYGVANQHGTPDLVAVAFGHGKSGYVKQSDLNCASGGDVKTLAEASAWDKLSQNLNVSVPVFNSDGVTVIGSWIVGDAAGPDSRTVPLSSLSLGC